MDQHFKLCVSAIGTYLKFLAAIKVDILVHKQMYWIRTNLRRFQPSNVICNIQMLVFHYISVI